MGRALILAALLGLVAPAAQADAGLAGMWSGLVTGGDGQPFEIDVTISRSGDQARIQYKGLQCGGTLKLLGRAGPAFTYREDISYGATACPDGRTVHLTPSADGVQVAFERTGGGTPLTATLNGIRFVVTPETCDECLDAEILDKMACAFEAGTAPDGRPQKADPNDPKYVACFTEAGAHGKICRQTYECTARSTPPPGPKAPEPKAPVTKPD